MGTFIRKLIKIFCVNDEKCKKCKNVCNAIRFQQDFKNWTSGNNDIDKFIQDTQLSAHNNAYKVLEWIPYDRFCDVRCITKDKFRKEFKANWIDGCIYNWDNENQNWNRKNQNMFVILKSLDNLNNIILELNELSAHNNVHKVLEWIPYDRIYYVRCIANDKFCEEFKANWIDGCIHDWDNYNKNWRRRYQDMFIVLKSINNLNNISLEFNEITSSYKVCGITQDPKTKDYMFVCRNCSHICNVIYFQRNFKNWTSGNVNIDKFIQDSQLSTHRNIKNMLEWIPYNRFCNINYIEKDEFEVNWIDGCIDSWDNHNQNWRRKQKNMFVILKSINNLDNITFEFNERNFKNWTSGNHNVDEFIQGTQRSVHTIYEIKNALEWIPYDRFCNLEYIAKGGFGKVYKANWIDGCVNNWDDDNQNWKRKNQNMFVALKVLHNSNNVTSEFMNEIASHFKINSSKNIIRLYGLSQDPVTKNYIMVLDYAKNGSLRNFLDTNYKKWNLNYKFNYLEYLASGLEHIHKNDLIHRDLHSGNVLVLNYAKITDLGLCKPADYNPSENTKNNVYGILPYVAPEILRGQSYTKASDIYSLGIIMYEIISGLPPYHDKSHDEKLAIKICKGLRPSFNIKVPQSTVYLIKRCLDADPSKRPTIEEIKEIINQWCYRPNEELQRQIKEAEETNNNLPTDISSTNLGISYKTHSEAIYTSRLLNYNSLSEPKNSDDYYKQNDNIMSKEFLESLEINVSQLEIDDNNRSRPKIISTESSASLSQQIDISQLNIKDEKF
ncbi:kinase-like domain-containing protein [Rhizophagus clarus]|uniref:Kinase-like domain-containing protein n=1 Tax=Rhizophagus clarus TaxID=94130 RepID=A0A8H3LJ67_9GLOM|nr:kinase-like domain-containing protein [Rhizophagus clarus]